jgi:putative transposase
MVRYRRNFQFGGTFFFTVTLRDRRSNLLVDRIELLRDAFRVTMLRRPFEVDAIVVLPDHLHAIWTLPSDDADYPERWRAIKSRFVRGLKAAGDAVPMSGRGECMVWQRRFWEHTIRDERDLANHVDYVHYNPVRHGLVSRVADWPYSSFHRFVARGDLPPDWADEPDDTIVDSRGEPV